MHTLRHTAAVMLLSAGVDTSTIALWLGHEQERTTHIYLHADLAIKQRALDRATPPNGRPGRYRPPDPLLAFSKISDAIMPTFVATNRAFCGEFQAKVGMPAGSALLFPCRRRHGYRLLHVAARLAFHGRRGRLRLQHDWPWASQLAAAFGKLKALPAATG